MLEVKVENLCEGKRRGSNKGHRESRLGRRHFKAFKNNTERDVAKIVFSDGHRSGQSNGRRRSLRTSFLHSPSSVALWNGESDLREDPVARPI